MLYWSSTVTSETEHPLQPVMNSIVRQAVSLQHCGSMALNSSSSERGQPC